jgi:hypothetical protein
MLAESLLECLKGRYSLKIQAQMGEKEIELYEIEWERVDWVDLAQNRDR